VTLGGGATIAADLVVVGVGVRPRLALAERPGSRSIAASWSMPDWKPACRASTPRATSRAGRTRTAVTSMRVEHWVVAQRQGQTAALNMLGGQVKFDAVPFFWSQHYDVAINYAGHAQAWDELTIEGDIASRDCAVRYKSKGSACWRSRRSIAMPRT
jgi:NADPH-dependent 2,4-dienoyl-CoA reductase/sulfur reductase-like enzyme